MEFQIDSLQLEKLLLILCSLFKSSSFGNILQAGNSVM